MNRPIHAQMTVLEAVCACRATEAVFRAQGEAIGVCLLCQELFETIADVALRHGLDLDALLDALNDRCKEAGPKGPESTCPAGAGGSR